MTPREAKLLLAARRPNGADDTDPALAEALTVARHDSNTGVFARSERLFDQQVASKLRQVMPPLDLKERILAGRRGIASPTPVSSPSSSGPKSAARLAARTFTAPRLDEPLPRRNSRRWLFVGIVAGALAAATTVAITISAVQDRERAAAVAAARSSDSFRKFLVGFLKDWDQNFDLPTRDYSRVTGWLSTQPGAVEMTIPPALLRNPTEGCKVLEWNDHPVTLVGFRLAGWDAVVHLMAISQDQLSDSPGELARYSREGGWNTATWTRKGVTYFAFSKADLETLKRLF